MRYLRSSRDFFVLVIAVLFFVVFNFTYCHKRQTSDSVQMEGDSVSFIVFGDWGKYGGQYQKPVADQMDILSRLFNVSFIISTGDNFYNSGVAGVNDPHWKASFEDIYNKKGHQVEWYPVLGNHDYGNNPQAQVEYSNISSRWKMPGRYHSITKKINATTSVLIAFTDTSPFVGEYFNTGWSDLAKQDTAAQLKWLKQTLSPPASWKLAVGHHPVYSVGPHGNTSEILNRFKPVFLETKTDLYLCGHDHSLQFLRVPGEYLRYVVSGGGSENTAVHQNAYSLFASSSPGFTLITLYANAANIYFYNHMGELLNRQQIRK